MFCCHHSGLSLRHPSMTLTRPTVSSDVKGDTESCNIKQVLGSIYTSNFRTFWRGVPMFSTKKINFQIEWAPLVEFYTNDSKIWAKNDLKIIFVGIFSREKFDWVNHQYSYLALQLLPLSQTKYIQPKQITGRVLATRSRLPPHPRPTRTLYTQYSVFGVLYQLNSASENYLE